MDGIDFGANDLDLQEIEAILAEEGQSETPPTSDDASHTNTDNGNTDVSNSGEDVSKTKAFAHRLRESTDKARKEERENIAKSLGYESYDAMIKDREHKTMTDKGLDPEQVGPVIDELVQKRINSDPRMQELEELRKRQVAQFAKEQLASITELTDGEITSLSQLSPEVIEVFKKTGDLSRAYIQVEGVNLINKIKAGKTKGTTDHLANPSGSTGSSTTTRALTEEEKRVWKLFNPQTTDEELNKMRKPV